MPDLAEPKTLLRQRALARRRVVDPRTRARLTSRLVDEGVACARQWRARAVAVFYPIGDEPDGLALIAALAAEDFATALPVVVSRDAPLTFRLWRIGDPTVVGRRRIPEPPPEAAAVEPDLLFVPLAAFDRRGYRLGYGGGYYDRTLRRLRAAGPIRAVGVAYAACEVAAVPDEAHDEPLDFILTEREWIAARSFP